MKILVQKFGGTSVATAETRCAAIGKVKKALEDGYAPVVVVSAMGRKGQPYATDTLIGVLKTVNPAVAAHELDMIMCCGEMISASVMAAEMQRDGLEACALTGGQAGICTDEKHGMAKIRRIDTDALLKLLEQGVIPVVCGFQGVTEETGQLSTLGRGGSDTTAAALGAALDAAAVEIYTDVNGIMTADPRLVADAKIMERIPYGAVCELAEQGAKVIHPRAVEIAMKKNIPLYVKCTFEDCPGTLITSSEDFKVEQADREVAVSFISGVTYIEGITQAKVLLNGTDEGQHLFQLLADEGISVSCLNLSLNGSMFAIYSENTEACRSVLRNHGFHFKLTEDCAKVSVVGISVKGMPGLMATFVNALTEKGISILQTVDSATTISAIIPGVCLKEAVQALHAAYHL